MSLVDLLRGLGNELAQGAGELAIEELIAEHGPKVAVLRALAQLRKLHPTALRVLAAHIDACPVAPGEETRARSAAAELVQALADWNEARG